MSGRGFNWQIWVGLALSIVGFASYRMYFEQWPITRDVPWANLLLFGAAALLLWSGMRRAYAPGRWRLIRVSIATTVVLLSVAVGALFVYVRYVIARLPASANAPKVGERVPEFTLLDEHGRTVSLSSLLSTPNPVGAAADRAPRGVLLIFYMYSGCRACNSEFHGMQQNLGALAAAGIRPVAISIDPPDVSRRLSDDAGYTFTFLSDPKMDVIRRYDVADQYEGARPAEFLVDAGGVVRWRNLTTNVYVRATPAEMFDAARLLN